jgi:hypothetical protein
MSFSDGAWNAICRKCGKARGPSPTVYQLLVSWDDLVPAETFEVAVEQEISAILKEVPAGGEVEWKKVLQHRPNQSAAKRAAVILNGGGIIKTRYVAAGEEISYQKAKEFKAAGVAVEVFCSR